MADKVQKIREEVVRMHNLLPIMDGDNIYVNYADRICTTLEMYIDSLQEEPIFHVGDTIRHKEENDSFKILAIEDDCYKLENNIVVSIAAQDSWELVEEPISEELEQEIDKYVNIPDNQGLPDLRRELSDCARHFANWQKEQDKETIELAEDHAMFAGMVKGTEHTIGKVRSILNKVAYENNGLDVNGDYCEQPYVELDSEFKNLLKEG